MKKRQRPLSAIANEKFSIIEAIYNAAREGHLKQLPRLHKQLEQKITEYQDRYDIIEEHNLKKQRRNKPVKSN